VTGVVDKPFEQVRDPMWLDLSGAAGNVPVIGAPVTGKTTFLRTLVCGMALMHTPRETQFYCLARSNRLVRTCTTSIERRSFTAHSGVHHERFAN
jgi:DNA segregation ATPase FtsK/SpoIIIE-like protein